MKIETMNIFEAVADYIDTLLLRKSIQRELEHVRGRQVDASVLRNGQQVSIAGNRYTFMYVIENDLGNKEVKLIGRDGDSVWYHDLRSFELTAKVIA
jgi:hypothetical protein